MPESDILGIGAMSQNFRALRTGMETRVARLMVVAAGGVLKKKAKAIAQANGSVRSGAMVKNIAIKREPSAPAGSVEYHMGVRNGGQLTKKQKSTAKLAVNSVGRIVKKYQDDPYYWRWVERGHRVVPRAILGDKSFTASTYYTRLRNGKLAVRTAKRATQSLRSRRRAAIASVAAKPFLGPALEQGRQEALDAMARRLQAEHDKVAAA